MTFGGEIRCFNHLFVVLLLMRKSPIAICILTNIKLSVKETQDLPENIHLLHVSWRHLISKLEEFLGVPQNELDIGKHRAGYYRFHDVKPFVPFLFPELFGKYERFGWLDSDIWLSSKLMDLIAGSKFDFYTGLTWSVYGPLTVFTNSFYQKYIKPELQQNYLKTIFMGGSNYYFDERGKPRSNVSMHIILHKINSTVPNIRWANHVDSLGMIYCESSLHGSRSREEGLIDVE